MTGLLLAVAVAASPTRAVPPPAGPQADADRVMRLVAAGGYEPAGEELARQYVWPGPKDRFAGMLKHYREVLASIGSNLGAPLGEADLVRVEPLGRSLARLVYVVKFDKHVVAWRLTYYRPAVEWKLHAVTFDVDPQVVEKLFGTAK